MSCPEQVAADPEQILDDAVHRCEPLQMGGRLEAAHLALTLTGRLMRDVRAIVFILPGTKEGMASPRGTDHILRRDYRLVIAAA